MVSKLYSKVNQFLKENIMFIIGMVLFYLVINMPLPYYIHTAGGLIDITDKVTIEGEYKQEGSINLTYVSEIKGNVLTCLMSYVFPNWDLVRKEEVYPVNETYEDATYRNQLFLTEANQNAVFLAYQEAGKYININKQNHYLVYIDKIAKTNLKIKDEILLVENQPISSVIDYQNIVNNYKVGDKLTIKVKDEKGKEIDKYIEVIEYEGIKITGIYFVTKYDYITNPKIKFNFKESESGASGGLMMTLSIYNKLTKEDITKGKKIVGTGTIDLYGNVGEISGIKYKLKGAVRNKADIFFVPNGSNYEEAIALKAKNDYNIQIISISTFVDALNYLNEL